MKREYEFKHAIGETVRVSDSLRKGVILAHVVNETETAYIVSVWSDHESVMKRHTLVEQEISEIPTT